MCLILGITAAPEAKAGSASAGYANSLFTVPSAGVLLFAQTGTRSGAPSCQSTVYPKTWALNVSTPAGQAALATLLTAYAQHKQVVVEGDGTCGVWGDTETVSYFYVVD